MEVALRRRLEGVAAISISQQDQTAEVSFVLATERFSPEQFRAAVGEADVEVLAFEIEACGMVASGAQGGRWFVAGANRFSLKGEVAPGNDGVGCVSATLDDRRAPYELVGLNRVP
jgi:FAD synthase